MKMKEVLAVNSMDENEYKEIFCNGVEDKMYRLNLIADQVQKSNGGLNQVTRAEALMVASTLWSSWGLS